MARLTLALCAVLATVAGGTDVPRSWLSDAGDADRVYNLPGVPASGGADSTLYAGALSRSASCPGCCSEGAAAGCCAESAREPPGDRHLASACDLRRRLRLRRHHARADRPRALLHLPDRGDVPGDSPAGALAER